MSDLYETRRVNLRVLVAEHGNGEISKAAGYKTASYLSQMIGAKARREITEKTARKVEQALHLPTYWLDQERDPTCDPLSNNIEHVGGGAHIAVPNMEPVSILVKDETERFNLCAKIVHHSVGTQSANLSHIKFSKIVWLVFQLKSDDEEDLKNFAENLIRIAI